MNKQDNVPQVKTVPTPITGSADYIENVYGTRTFARALMVDDAKSIMDLMDDFADQQTDPLKARIEELEASNAKYREALEDIVTPIKYLRKGLKDGEQLNGYYAAQLAKDPYFLKKIAEEALNSKEVGGES